MLYLSSRILRDDGISIVSSQTAAEMIVTGGEIPPHVKVSSDRHSDEYERIYHLSISGVPEDVGIFPVYDYTLEECEEVLDYILLQRRDDTSVEAHEARLIEELEFFIDNDLVSVLVSMKRLIDRFREDGVVWGVGRGSSCASYALFLLGVHDINPILFDISFTEFSKT